MAWIGAAAAVALMALVLLEAFAVMILPRRVKHVYMARLFYRVTWRFWRAARLKLPTRWQNPFLSVFGPLSLLALLAMWAAGLIVAFALLHWSAGSAISGMDGSFLVYLYFSATTFFTLGFGDLVPTGPLGRTLSAAEAGL